MKTIIDTVSLSAVCPPSNPGVVMGQVDEEATGGWLGRPYKETQGSGKKCAVFGISIILLFYWPFSVTEMLLSAICLFFFFCCKIRPTRVMEGPPVQVDTRLRWFFFFPVYFDIFYVLFYVCFLHNFHLFSFVVVFIEMQGWGGWRSSGISSPQNLHLRHAFGATGTYKL